MKKLNFGCGSIQPEGWVNFDKNPEFKADNYEFHQNEFDIIVAHAVIQQFEWHEMVGELKMLWRLLKPGGVLRISLPDIVAGFQAYMNDNIDWFPNGEKEIGDRFSAWLTWYSTSKTLLTRGALEGKLQEAGFTDFARVGFKISWYCGKDSEIISLDTRENEFFFYEAKK